MIVWLLRRVSTDRSGEVVSRWLVDTIAWKTLLFNVAALIQDADLAALMETGCAGVACVFMQSASYRRLGVLLLMIAAVHKVLWSFPYTLNHAFFELLLLAEHLAWRWSDSPEGASHDPSRFAKLGILSVFFYAGLQKLVHGYYLDGQFLALKVLYGHDGMSVGLRALLSAMHKVMDLPMPQLPTSTPSWLSGAAASLPQWMIASMTGLSITVVLLEIVCPIAALVPRLRRSAILGLLGLEACIAIASRELSFAFTTTACLLAFFPEAGRWSYPVAFAALSLLTVGLMLAR